MPTTATCHHCASTYTPRTRTTKYCGTTCQHRAFNARRKADGRLKAYRQRPDVRARQATWMAQHRHKYGHDHSCPACGKGFRTRHGSRYCSRDCGRWATARTTSCPVPNTHPSRSTAVPYCRQVGKQTRFACGRCRHCGTPFTMDRKQHHSLDYVYCTKQCQHRSHKAQRAARKRGNLVEVFARPDIFERDGWRCQLCGHKVRRDVAWNHPQSPTIDHIIPLARGGTHEPRNVHCAHRICNSNKSDRGGGEQLALL